MDKAYIKDRLFQYGLLMRMDKPIGTLLLLWPTLWALWIAGEGRPDARVLVIFVLGVFLMRSAGCVINDFADRDIDPYVKRTMNRPLAAKKVSAKEALALFVVLCLAALGLVLTMNELTVLLAFPGAVLAATYPFMKRFTHLPQVHLGVAFGWAVVKSLADQGLQQVRIPFLQLAATALVAVLAGVAAAVLPARRASRVNILDAVAP